jgi:hypothetical protein
LRHYLLSIPKLARAPGLYLILLRTYPRKRVAP